jgi:hypothetical protein
MQEKLPVIDEGRAMIPASYLQPLCLRMRLKLLYMLDAEVYTDLAPMTTGLGSYARRCPVSSGMLLLCQAMAKSKGHGGGPVLASRLVENVREMMGNRFLAEPQLLTDLNVS